MEGKTIHRQRQTPLHYSFTINTPHTFLA